VIMTSRHDHAFGQPGAHGCPALAAAASGRVGAGENGDLAPDKDEPSVLER
jgi:hypothetical protein